MIYALVLRCLMFSTFFIASTVLFHISRLYLTGTFLLFSNSNVGSTANSLPAVFLDALVHLVLRGFFFFLNAAWHFDRQNLKIWKRTQKWGYVVRRTIVKYPKTTNRYHFGSNFNGFTYFAVVSDKLNPVAGIYVGRTKITRFYAHGETSKERCVHEQCQCWTMLVFANLSHI